MRFASCLLLLLITATFGCATDPAGPEPTAATVTLYAIDPVSDTPDGFRGYRVIGSVDLTGTAEGAALAAYLEEEADLPQGLITGCFEPRHGLRVVRDGQASDYVICFSCRQFDWYLGTGSDGKQEMDPAWYDRFTRPLTDAGIELAD